jgi:hypothetical protein
MFGLSQKTVKKWYTKIYLGNKEFHASAGAPTRVSTQDIADIKEILQTSRASNRPMSSTKFKALLVEKVQNTARKRGHEPRDSIDDKTVKHYKDTYEVHSTNF